MNCPQCGHATAKPMKLSRWARLAGITFLGVLVAALSLTGLMTVISALGNDRADNWHTRSDREWIARHSEETL